MRTLKDVLKRYFFKNNSNNNVLDIEIFIDQLTKSILQGKFKAPTEEVVKSFKQISVKNRYYEALIGGPKNHQERFNQYLYGEVAIEYQKIKEQIRFNHEYLSNYGLFFDRICEFKNLYSYPIHEITTKSVLQDKIEQHDLSTDEGLHKALGDVAYLYFLRKMQLPTLNDIDRFQKIVENYFSGEPGLKILDYGCGSGDVSIFALKKGHKVTICDVKGANLDFAIKRFKLRNMEPTVWESTPENPLPFKENSQFHIINCLEVLEHLRNPLEFIDKVYKSLTDNGVFILGSFPFHSTNDRGDHIAETVKNREKILEYLNSKFQRTEFEKENTFIKKLAK